MVEALGSMCPKLPISPLTMRIPHGIMLSAYAPDTRRMGQGRVCVGSTTRPDLLLFYGFILLAFSFRMYIYVFCPLFKIFSQNITYQLSGNGGLDFHLAVQALRNPYGYALLTLCHISPSCVTRYIGYYTPDSAKVKGQF